VHGILLIGHDFAAPFPVAGIRKRLAEAGGGPEVDGQDGITAVGEPLVPGVETPRIACPRATVWGKHRGQ
jgi:hypothetical protein